MGRRNKKRYSEMSPLELRTFQWIDTITETIISKIGIECPDDCTIDWNRVLEWGIMRNSLLMFNDPLMGDTVTNYAGENLDIYQNFVTARPVYPNGNGITELPTKSVEIDKDGVLLWFTPRHRNDFTTWLERIEYTAKMLAVIDETIALNVDLQKTPVVVACSENNALEINKFFEDFEAFKRVCTVSKKTSNVLEDMETFDFKGTYVADKLKDLQNCLLFDLLSLIGVNNSNVDKSQYVGSFEINANNEYLYIRDNTLLGELNKSFDKYNKLFGTSFRAYDIFKEEQEAKQAEFMENQKNDFGVGDSDNGNDND